jgi:hypothetical protein
MERKTKKRFLKILTIKFLIKIERNEKVPQLKEFKVNITGIQVLPNETFEINYITLDQEQNKGMFILDQKTRKKINFKEHLIQSMDAWLVIDEDGNIVNIKRLVH